MRKHTSTSQPVEIAREAFSTARQAAQDIDLDAAKGYVDTARRAAQDLAADIDLEAVRDTVTGETRRRPLPALLVALGLGTVVGAVVTRRRKPKPARIEDWTPRA